MRDKHLDRLRAIKKKVERDMRLAAGIKTGRAGIHLTDKRERRVRHMGTKEWMEEVEGDEDFMEDDNGPLSDIPDEILVVCYLCGEAVPENTAHRHQGKWIGDECCWDERLRTTE